MEQITDIYKQTAQNISSLIQYTQTDPDTQIMMRRQFGNTAIDMVSRFTQSEVANLSLVAWELSKVGDGSKQIKDGISPAEYIHDLFDSSYSLRKHRGKLTRLTLLLNAQIAQQQSVSDREGRQIPFPYSKQRTLQA